MKKYNYIVAAVLLVVGIGMIVGTMDFPYHGLSDIGGGFWPKLLGGARLLCSIGLALETALKKQPDEVTIDFRSEGMKRVLIALGIMVVFSVLTYILGFFVGTFFMVISCAILLGERNKVKLLAIPVGVIVFIYVVFEMVLHTNLPAGILF